MATYQLYRYMETGETLTLATLSAPGNSDILHTAGCGSFKIQYTIASIDTNVVLRVEGSLDNSNWFNLDFDGQDVTETADGTDSFQYDCDGDLPWARLKFVSESGGIAATIALKVTAAPPQYKR